MFGRDGVVGEQEPHSSEPKHIWAFQETASVTLASTANSPLTNGIGMEAVREYLQTKSVWISTARDVPDPFVLR